MLPGAIQFFAAKKAAPPLPYDAEVAWIEGTGTQWLDTGITPSAEMVLRVGFSRDSSPSQLDYFPFYLAAARGRSYAIGYNYSNILLWLGTGGAGYSAPYDDSRHDVVFDFTGDQTAYFDGSLVYTRGTAFAAITGRSIKLFAQSSTGEPTALGSGRLHQFSIEDKTTQEMVIDLVPVRFTNELGQTEGAMYDRVSGQLFRNAGTGAFAVGPDKSQPSLPYDDEVAYIERDCSIPWVDSGGAEIAGGFDLSRYNDPNETLGAMRPLEATWSFEPLSDGSVWAVYRQSGLLQRGAMKVSNKTVYSFVNAASGHTSVEGNLDVFHTQIQRYEDGRIMGYIDGVLIMDQEGSGSAKIQNLFVMRSSVNTGVTSYYTGKIRVSNVKIGDDVDLIPVVKGSAVGFYNRVDGEMFLEEQACLSAGPRV